MIFPKKAVTILMMTMVLFATGCHESNRQKNGNGENTVIETEAVVDSHEYVDLGLPSGTLWATCNVGAEVPEASGDFFAWGETKPKAKYTWWTYEFYTTDDANDDVMTKYTMNDGFETSVDQLAVLQPEDDPATVLWGTAWSTPTKEQCEELCDHTTKTFTSLNGVNGRLFTASNGNSIFLPAAGAWSDELFTYGTGGDYWSSSLDIHYAYMNEFDELVPEVTHAFALMFSRGTCYVGDRERYYGKCIRPVRSLSNQ